MLGFPSAAASDDAGLGQWLIADTSQEAFGQPASNDVLGDAEGCVTRERTGLVSIDGEWVHMQRVLAADVVK